MTEVIGIFKDRLNEALEKRDVRPVDLAKRTDIPEATISQYRSGYAKPKYERIVKIADALNVSLEWLMGGDVPMEKNRTRVRIGKLYVPEEGSGPTHEYTMGNGASFTPDPEDIDKMMNLFLHYQNAQPHIQKAIDSLLDEESDS